MKKFFITLSALILTVNLSAQTEAGTFYISLGTAFSPINQYNYLFKSNGMNLGSEWVTDITIDGDNDDDFGNNYFDKDQQEKTVNISSGGQFGYFITNGLSAGLGIEYASYTNILYQVVDHDEDGYDDEHTIKQMSTSLSISPYIKHYFSVGQNALFVSTSYTLGKMNNFLEEEIYYASSRPNYEEEDKSEPLKTTRLGLGAGMAFFVTQNISLEPSVNFAISTYTQDMEVYIGDTGLPDFTPIYEDQEKKIITNAFYFKIVASMYF